VLIVMAKTAKYGTWLVQETAAHIRVFVLVEDSGGDTAKCLFSYPLGLEGSKIEHRAPYWKKCSRQTVGALEYLYANISACLKNIRE
jgi:hypothetical protein